MINKLLFWYTRGLPCRLIKLESGPYLERYLVGVLFGVMFYLHRFVSSDSERHVHNHPWKHGGSLILTGGYIEEYVTDICPHAGDSGCITEFKKRQLFNSVNGSKFHRIHNAKHHTWTLFFHGKRQRVKKHHDGTYYRVLKSWGFLEQAGTDDDGPTHTVFTPYKSRSGNPDDWSGVPPGRDAGRQPL